MAVATDKEREWRKRFGENLRNIMKERGLTQMALAYDFNSDISVISNYVNGKSTPTAYTLFELAKFLNVTPNRLGGWYDET